MSHEETIIKQNQEIIKQNDFIIKMLKAALPDAGKNLWMNEDEVLAKLNCSVKSLYRKRKAGFIQWRYAGEGREVQYQRKSVEEYLLSKSTLNKGNLKVA